MKSIRSAAILFLLFLTLPAAGAEITLESLMSSAFPSSLEAAPAGGSVAWVQNSEGVRNIWVAQPPAWKGRQLTSYTAADGQNLSDLQWTPDGTSIVYVRGGGANRQGEFPNPTSDPEGVEQILWRIGLDGGEPVKIGSGSSPAISPRGDVVVFVQKGEIHRASLDGSEEPQVMVKMRGNPGSLRWSSDGSKLAFVSNRGKHAFVGVHDLAEKSVRYLSPSVDRDSDPVWSPDGTRLVFLRTPTETTAAPFRPRRSAQPWSILVGNLESGETRTIWKAELGRGSAFWGVVAENQLLWGAGDNIVFPSELAGWVQLYSVPASGGKATLLTPGELEVEYVEMTPDRRFILYNSNQGDLDRRHLWKVPVDGSTAPVAVTRGTGIEWAPTPTSEGRAIAFLRSDARTPAHAAIILDGKVRTLAPESIPETFPTAALVEPQQVIFDASDGMKIRGQLFVPPNLKSGTRAPAVLYFHGGSRRQMLLGWHYMSYYHNFYAASQYLASRGYVVLSVNYRSGIGYGMEFREALDYGARGASEFRDVVGAALYLRSRTDVDPDRIGLWGGSYGGYLTALGLARAPELFAAGVDIHGVHDWNVVIRNFAPDYDPLKREADATLALSSSPMSSLDNWRAPVLVIHGDDDRNVPFLETVTLVEELRERDVEVEQLIFPDEVHGFLLHENWLAAFRASVDFFDRRLKR